MDHRCRLRDQRSVGGPFALFAGISRLRRTASWRRVLTVVVGAVLTISGTFMLVGVAVDVGQAAADTAPFELFCTGTPLGNLALNDVVMTGTLSPASPSPGQQFNLEDFQTQITIPADVVQQAAAVGNTSLTGTATTTIVASGATPSTLSTGALAYDEPIPSPVPTAGLPFDVPTTPATLGPFTATSDNISLNLGPSIELTFTDVVFRDCRHSPARLIRTTSCPRGWWASFLRGSRSLRSSPLPGLLHPLRQQAGPPVLTSCTVHIPP